MSYFSFWVFASGGLTMHNLGINSIYLIMSLLPVYINSRILMPKILNRGKFILYFFSLISLILIFTVLLYLGLFSYFTLFGLDKSSFFETPNIIGSTLGAISMITLGLMIVEIIRNSLRTQKLNQQLEKEKLETELKFLRSQLNPHFLFNALNNIYFLIQKDQTKAAEALAKFSEMLRYQLYDCNAENIPLSQELEYLDNYINIASLSHKEVNLNINITKEVNGQLVTPLLLIPFVENAFKYVSAQERKEKFINISLDLTNNVMIYKVANSLAAEVITEKKRGGIGLDNIRRRLNLIYPNEHELKHHQSDDSYQAELKLEL